MSNPHSGIYSLNNPAHLKHDINYALNQLGLLYDVEFKNDKIEALPKTKIEDSYFWLSKEVTDIFNELVPKLKSLHKDMYATIESLHRGLWGDFNIKKLETQYPHFREFRLFNNRLKHFESNGISIELTQLVIMNQQGFHLIDMYCNFLYKDEPKVYLRFIDFVNIFLTILEDNKAITINIKEP
jgi:hypothetical protein